MNKLPKYIVFDAFGTLVKIGNTRSPYLRLMKWQKQRGRKPTCDDASIIMSKNVSLSKIANFFGHELPLDLLLEINADLKLDLDSIELYSDTTVALENLKKNGFKIVLCSNLAMPYGERLKEILPNLFEELVLSYEVGCIKPNTKIYNTMMWFR